MTVAEMTREQAIRFLEAECLIQRGEDEVPQCSRCDGFAISDERGGGIEHKAGCPIAKRVELLRSPPEATKPMIDLLNAVSFYLNHRTQTALQVVVSRYHDANDSLAAARTPGQGGGDAH
jgi:hypothetical protein